MMERQPGYHPPARQTPIDDGESVSFHGRFTIEGESPTANG